MDHDAPWLYDVDEDAEAELSDSNEYEAQMSLLSSLATTPVQRDRAVRCHGVDVNGAPCTRTSTQDELRSSKYCYRHRHQKQHRSADASSSDTVWCSRYSCGWSLLRCVPRTRIARSLFNLPRCRVWCSFSLALSSLVLTVFGIIKKDAALCLSGAVGLLASMVWMCVVACEVLCRAVPPEIAAQVAFSALHAQVRGKCDSSDYHGSDDLEPLETADSA